MLSTLVAAALVAGGLCMPHVHKREYEVVVETVTDVVYVYDVVTVTATNGAVSSTTSVFTTSTTSLVTSTTAARGFSLLNHLYDDPADSSSATVTTSEPISPPVGPSVVSNAWSTSLPPVPTSAIVTPVVAPPPPTTSTTSSTSPPVVPTTSISAAESSTVVAPVTTDRQVTGYRDLVVAHHNVHRRNHSAPDMIWDNALAAAAFKIAESCVYAHDVSQTDRDAIGGYGQNIAAGVGADNISVVITELFYNGEVHWYNGLYGQKQPDMSNFENWGHFSQIVWRDTTKVGCWTSHCANGLANVANNVPPFFTVCNYQAPGNVAGQYDKVGYSLNLPTVHWNYYN